MKVKLKLYKKNKSIFCILYACSPCECFSSLTWEYSDFLGKYCEINGIRERVEKRSRKYFIFKACGEDFSLLFQNLKWSLFSTCCLNFSAGKAW